MPPSRAWLGLSLRARFAAPLALSLLAAAGVGWPSAQAQPVAQVEADVPEGPLTAALNRFAQQSGVSIAVDAERLRNLRTPGLKGRHRVEEGFNALLRGSGFVVGRTAAGYVLVAAPVAPASPVLAPPQPSPQPQAATPPRETSVAARELPAMRVTATADKETAWSAVPGYVASRSATGTKSDTALIETPQSITVVTSDQIAALAPQSVAQTLRYVGGVTSEPRGSMTALDFFYVRGFTLNQYLDGLKTLSGGYSLPQPDPYLLERVEVLRGPSSVLYGQADPGGVLNLVSKRPNDAAMREVQLQLGAHDRKQLGLDFGGSLAADNKLSGRITAIARDADTQVDHAREQRVALAPSLSWKPDADTSLTLLANYQKDPHVGYYNWIPAYGTVLPNPYRPGERLPTGLNTGDPGFDLYSRESYSLADVFEHRFNSSVLLRQGLRYAHVKSAFDQVYSSYLDADFHTLNRYAWHLRDKLDALTADQHLQFSFRTGDVAHTLLTGLDYQQNRYRQQLGYNFASGSGAGEVPPLDIYAPVYGQAITLPDFASDAVQRQRQLGLYVQDQLALGRWRLLVGGRKDWARSDSADALGGGSSSQRDDAITGRAGAVYLFDNGVAPYASYTQSFVPTAGTDFDGRLFKPSRGKQWEAGVKFQSADAQALAMLSLYQLTQTNVLSSDTAHPGFSLQTGEIRSRGVEVSGAANLSRAIHVTAAYSRLLQKVTQGGVDFGPAVGKTPTSIPKDTASVWGSFASPGWGGFGFGLGLRHVGASWGDDDNSYKVPARTLADAEVHIDIAADNEGKGWRLALNVSNLFDKVFVAGCGGADYCAYGERRNWLVTLGRRW